MTEADLDRAALYIAARLEALLARIPEDTSYTPPPKPSLVEEWRNLTGNDTDVIPVR